MKIEQFVNYIWPSAKKLRNDFLEKQQRAKAVSSLMEIVHGIKPDSNDHLFKLAMDEANRLTTKIKLAFDFGYLALDYEKKIFYNEEEVVQRYKEIIEYLQLVQAGIDSFVATHPIKAIEKGGTGDE